MSQEKVIAFQPRRSSNAPAPITLSPSRKRGVSSASFGSQSPPDSRDVKKLVIQTKSTPFSPTIDAPCDPEQARSTPKADPVQAANQSISILARAIACIIADPPERSPESLQSLYSLCEGIAASGSQVGQMLYDRIRQELDRRIGGVRLQLLKNLAPHEEWLRAVESRWRQFLHQMLLIRSIFLPLDRTFVLHRTSLLSIWDLGVDIFRQKIVEEENIGPRITAALVHFVQLERTGQLAPRPLFASVIGLLGSISSTSYVATFIQPFLESSRVFFTEEGNARITEDPTPVFLARVESRLAEEAERATAVLDPASTYAVRAQITRVVEQTLLSDHVHHLLPSALDASLTLIASDPVGDGRKELARLYNLLARVDALPKLRTAFSVNVEREGYKLVSDPERDETMIQSLLDYKLLIDGVVATAFSHDPDFGAASREAFQKFINKRQNKPAELMAKFVDAKMRAGNRGATDAELVATFDNVLALFRYTQGKDVWEAFYMRLFAKRLLLNKSASSDMEKIMLGKLRQECGAAFTAKLETMAKDVDLSNDLMQAYKRTHAASTDACDLSVNVLTTGHWPSFSNQPISIPPELSQTLEHFRNFYGSKHSGRVLNWQHSLDQCTLRARFAAGRKELNVSLYQALILMLFNELPDGESLTAKAIEDAIKLTGAELERTLQSLALGKVRVLSKEPKGRDIRPDDRFVVNDAFKSDNFKIKINQIQAKETAEENKKTTTSILLERKLVLEAAIVRFLKARKTMSHTDLVMELVSQLKDRFKVEPSEIKKSIDSLIEREYLERDPANPRSQYRYLA